MMSFGENMTLWSRTEMWQDPKEPKHWKQWKSTSRRGRAEEMSRWWGSYQHLRMLSQRLCISSQHLGLTTAGNSSSQAFRNIFLASVGSCSHVYVYSCSHSHEHSIFFYFKIQGWKVCERMEWTEDPFALRTCFSNLLIGDWLSGCHELWTWLNFCISRWGTNLRVSSRRIQARVVSSVAFSSVTQHRISKKTFKLRRTGFASFIYK